MDCMRITRILIGWKVWEAFYRNYPFELLVLYGEVVRWLSCA